MPNINSHPPESRSVMIRTRLSEARQWEAYRRTLADLSDDGNGVSERDVDIMIYGYDRDDWRECARRDYDREVARGLGLIPDF